MQGDLGAVILLCLHAGDPVAVLQQRLCRGAEQDLIVLRVLHGVGQRVLCRCKVGIPDSLPRGIRAIWICLAVAVQIAPHEVVLAVPECTDDGRLNGLVE